MQYVSFLRSFNNHSLYWYYRQLPLTVSQAVSQWYFIVVGLCSPSITLCFLKKCNLRCISPVRRSRNMPQCLTLHSHALRRSSQLISCRTSPRTITQNVLCHTLMWIELWLYLKVLQRRLLSLSHRPFSRHLHMSSKVTILVTLNLSSSDPSTIL